MRDRQGVARSRDATRLALPCGIACRSRHRCRSAVAVDRIPMNIRAAIAGLFGLATVQAQALTVPIIEYYNAGLDHFFVTGSPADIDALDSGRLPGWTR